VPALHNRGNLLLLVDSTMATPLASELDRFVETLEAEGWSVTRQDVERAEQFSKEGVRRTKDIINGWYSQVGSPGTVFLFGRIPVPYSGMVNQGQFIIAPDAHPDHRGAWPADAFYAFIGNEAGWTDVATDTVASRKANWNRAGDGKFDNAGIPNFLTLRVGRVDFYDMDAFKEENQSSRESETELLRNYLNKDYAYRTGGIEVKMRGLIDDNFNYFSGEAFARSGWISMAPLLGRENIAAADWFTTLDTAAYAWAYGCGGGTYTSAGGVGNTTDFVGKPINAIFTMLFGSYFGDWDSPNNFLRAGLATSPSILTSVWSGRPYWYFHTMGMGEPIGDAALLSQNNQSYARAFFTYGVHIALMGDPTLRMRYRDIPTPENITVHQIAAREPYVEIEWEGPESPEIAGYVIYRRVEGELGAEEEELLTPEPIATTRFQDTALFGKIVTYTVRAVALVESPSGTYFDCGNKGVWQSEIVAGVNDPIVLNADFTLNAGPNPARESVAIDLDLTSRADVEISIWNVSGTNIQTLETRTLAPGAHRYTWNRKDSDGNRVPSGVYLVRVITGGFAKVEKVVVE
ncbi:MAG: FlgD immunoglobulin-like domain containing protein, partial [Candidatus Kapaibacterium sp.]